MTDFGRFWVPGPVEVHPAILAAMARPMFHHRSEEAEELFARIQPGLRTIFGTRNEVFVLTASGTGAVEAGVRALPRGRVLALVNGAFSGRFAAMAEACGHEVDRFEVEFGEVHDPNAVAERAKRTDAVVAVHSETSTGALQPLGALAEAVGDVPLLIDSVSGAGGAAVDADEHGLAYACTGSQKALALPPGLSFAAPSPRLLELAAQAPDRGLYLDLLCYAKKQPPYTPSLPLLHALAAQIECIEQEGFEARLERHRTMAEQVYAWAEGAGLRILATSRSPTVTCLETPEPWTGPEFVRAVGALGYTLGDGYGKLKASTFRIGHMGDQTPATLDGLLAACTRVLATRG